MKSDRGMVTLMTVFSGIASLMCLLVGLQLLSLESQIGQASAHGLAGSDLQFLQWRNQVHTGAIMSLGAGVLVFLFGIRHHSTAGKPGRERLGQNTGPGSSTIDLESLSVRVFEVDAEDQTVEITSGDDTEPEASGEQPKIIWHPLDDQEADLEKEAGPVADPADSIVQSIQEASSRDPNRNIPPFAIGRLRNSFLGRFIKKLQG